MCRGLWAGRTQGANHSSHGKTWEGEGREGDGRGWEGRGGKGVRTNQDENERTNSVMSVNMLPALPGLLLFDSWASDGRVTETPG